MISKRFFDDALNKKVHIQTGEILDCQRFSGTIAAVHPAAEDCEYYYIRLVFPHPYSDNLDDVAYASIWCEDIERAFLLC